MYSWERKDPNGYEVSSKGDKRFSAFYAKMPDGRSLEQHYQCYVKGYDIGGTNWQIGKGKPPLFEVDLWEAYLRLWEVWAKENPDLIEDLRSKATGMILTDMFAGTDVNQARALATILNTSQTKKRPN